MVPSTYLRSVEAGPVGRIDQWPASSSRTAANTDGPSNRGKHSQSTEPAVVTRAAECRSDSSAWSAMGTALMTALPSSAGASAQHPGYGRPRAVPSCRPGMDRRAVRQGRIDHAPGLLHHVLAREPVSVAVERIVEQPLVGLLPLTERGVEVHLKIDGSGEDAPTRLLGLQGHRDPRILPQPQPHQVRLRVAVGSGEQRLGRTGQLDHGLERGGRHHLSGTHEERHPGPPPRVDVQPERGERLGRRAGGHPRLVPVVVELAAHQTPGVDRAHRPHDLHLLVAQRVGRRVHRRLHGQVRDHLEQVVLHDVPDRTDLVVEPSASRDPERLRHRHLHRRDVVTVPQRFEEGVCEAEGEQVLDRLLAQEVVDPQDRLLVEHVVQRRVEMACRLEVVAEGLLHDDPRPAVQARSGQVVHHGREQRRWDGQVVRGPLRRGQLAGEIVEGRGVAVVPGHEREPAEEGGHRVGVDVVDRGGDGVAGVPAERLGVHVGQRDADHGQVQPPRGGQCIQRGQQHLAGQVAGGTEEHQRVRVVPVTILLRSSSVDILRRARSTSRRRRHPPERPKTGRTGRRPRSPFPGTAAAGPRCPPDRACRPPGHRAARSWAAPG